MVTSGFHSHRTSNAESVSMSRPHHDPVIPGHNSEPKIIDNDILIKAGGLIYVQSQYYPSLDIEHAIDHQYHIHLSGDSQKCQCSGIVNTLSTGDTNIYQWHSTSLLYTDLRPWGNTCRNVFLLKILSAKYGSFVKINDYLHTTNL